VEQLWYLPTDSAKAIMTQMAVAAARHELHAAIDQVEEALGLESTKMRVSPKEDPIDKDPAEQSVEILDHLAKLQVQDQRRKQGMEPLPEGPQLESQAVDWLIDLEARGARAASAEAEVTSNEPTLDEPRGGASTRGVVEGASSSGASAACLAYMQEVRERVARAREGTREESEDFLPELQEEGQGTVLVTCAQVPGDDHRWTARPLRTQYEPDEI